MRSYTRSPHHGMQASINIIDVSMFCPQASVCFPASTIHRSRTLLSMFRYGSCISLTIQSLTSGPILRLAGTLVQSTHVCSYLSSTRLQRVQDEVLRGQERIQE